MNKSMEKEKKAYSDFIRKCLEEQQDKEFILQIPIRKGGTENGEKVRT